MESFVVVNCPTTELSVTNRAILNPTDTLAKFEHIAIRYPKTAEAFVFSTLASPTVERGKIGFNSTGRKWASIMVGKVVEAAPYKFEPQSQVLDSMVFSTDLMSRSNAQNIDFDTEEMSRQFSMQFYNQAFTKGQLFGFSYIQDKKRVVFELKVKDMSAISIEDAKTDVGTLRVEIGLTTANTLFMFERAEGATISLTGRLAADQAPPQIFSQNWDFSSMGIGGLSEQFNHLFRRAFASRLLPPKFAEEIGEEHVRGILLYGPPGTGKTLIARQIGKMLLAREPKVVNGPEVLNKFVGESEANIRALFKEAEEEQAKAGIHSGLHMIIFDEIDAICKSRGNSASTSGVGDSVVNQLLSKIDGVNSLFNVLLIGMTNRKDLIDEALLRPGRFEVQIEIGLPNRDGRLEILRIHTAKMQAKNIIDRSVDLEEVAALTRNYSGAELVGLIKAARSLAVTREIKADKVVDQEALDRIKITKDDFRHAMEHDVKPALGASEDLLITLDQPIIQWDPKIESILYESGEIVKMISDPTATIDRPYYVLFVGEPCSGLTTLGANMANKTKFPFIRVYEARTTAGESEPTKVRYIRKLFEDASRSEQSCIVIDDLDVIMDYCRIGPRYSLASRSVLATMKNMSLQKGKRMLVICTCKYRQLLDDLSLSSGFFDAIVDVPSLTNPKQVETALLHLQDMGDVGFSNDQRTELLEKLSYINFKMGIKSLKGIARDSARFNLNDQIDMFLKKMHSLNLVQRDNQRAGHYLDFQMVPQ